MPIHPPASSDNALREELAPGETLLWAGRPRQGVFLRASDLFLIPFSLLWGGFAVFWEATVITKGAPVFFALWGVPFVLAGLYMIVGRFFFDARQRADTHYGVTSERVLIITGWPTSRVTSMALRSLPEMSLDRHTGGLGTITFGRSGPAQPWSGSGGWPGGRTPQAPSFEMIAGAREVYETIRAAQRRHDTAGPRAE